MAKRRSVPMRVDANFKRMIEKVRLQRANRGDKLRDLSDRELTRMASNHEKLWGDLVVRPRRRNGQKR